VAKAVCQQWGWRTPAGRAKTFAARSLLLTLAQRYQLRLPPVRVALRRAPWGLGRPAGKLAAAAPPGPPVAARLASLQPLAWLVGGYGSPVRAQALTYLRQYHYLGCNRPVGTHLLYLVRDCHGRDVAVHLVGAAAWQCAPRDRFIGWGAAARAAGLPQIGQHSRFLLLPWIRVPDLASHLLGALARRLAADWPARHGSRLALLETFVETGRFGGTAYRAANWQAVGATTGRTRQAKQRAPQAPRKQVWVYPLHPRFREALGVPGHRGGGA